MTGPVEVGSPRFLSGEDRSAMKDYSPRAAGGRFFSFYLSVYPGSDIAFLLVRLSPQITTFELSSSGATLARSSLSLLGAIMCFILSVDFASLSQLFFFFRFLHHVQSHISGKRVFFFPTYLPSTFQRTGLCC